MKPITSIDLFSGAGGWTCGLEMAGIKSAGLFDIDKAACETARHNFKANTHCIDLTRFAPKKLPDGVNLIVGSPPCQGFSNEGEKNPEDPRNNLVWVFFDIIERLRPDVWVFENVPGFQRSYNGVFFDMLIERLEGMGYNYNHFLLEAQEYGVPQKRTRFIAIGAIDFVPKKPLPTHGNTLTAGRRFVSLWDAISDLPAVGIGERVGEFDYTKLPQNSYQEWARGGSNRIYNHTTQKHSERVLEKIRSVQSGNDMSQIIGKFQENRVHYMGGYRRALKNEPSYTVYWTRGMTSIHPEQDRFLSPRECARLQSFPDRFVFRGTSIQNYTQVGNAVPPLLAKRIGEYLSENMGDVSRERSPLAIGQSA